jgi:hypothetical protein
MDNGNLKVSLSLLATTFHTYAKKAGTRTEKHQLYEIVEGLGTAIAKQNTTIGTQGGNKDSPGQGIGNTTFNPDAFMSECGVSPDWATLAA